MVCLAFALTLVFAVEEDVADAQETIKLMMSQGADANACKDLAETAIKEIKSTFTTNQELLVKIDTGSACVGQASVDASVLAATEPYEAAIKEQATAQANVAAAEKVVPKCEVPSMRTLSQNSGKTADWLYSCPAYVAASDALVAADTALNAATATVTKTKTNLESAKGTASKQAKTCLCGVVAASDTAWTTMSAAGPVNDRAISWTKSQNILCALSGTSPCTFPAVPEVTRSPFSPDTAAVAEQCRTEAAKEVADKLATDKANSERNSQLFAGITVGCFRDVGVGWPPRYGEFWTNVMHDFLEKKNHEQCRDACKSRGYKFMGRQYFQQCWCTNDYGSNPRSRECGDVKDNCDIRNANFYGDNHNCVYQIRD